MIQQLNLQRCANTYMGNRLIRGRGLHSSTFRLNLGAFCGIGGAFRGCLGGDWRVLGRYQGVFRVYFVSEPAQVEMRSGRV